MNDSQITTRSALWIALIYAVLGGLWILFSDKVVAAAFTDPDAIIRVSMLKGWFYVGTTSLLLFFLVRHYLGRLRSSFQREIDNYSEKQRTHDLLSAIADNSEDAIFAKDRAGRYLLFNPAASRFVGKPAAEVLGRDDRAIFPADQAEMLMAAGERIIATGNTETGEEVLDTALGRRTFLSTKGPLRDGEQRIFGIFGISRDITGIKDAQDALLENEARLRMLIQNSPAALAMFDREMRYLAASDRWAHDFGLGEGDIVGRCHYELFPEIGDELKALHRRGLAGEAIRKDEDRFERAEGSVQWLRWELRPWRETDGGIGGIVIYAEDITGRMASEIALRESEHRFHDIVRATADWIWEVDLAGRYTYVSDSVYGLLGYTPAELIGKTAFELMPPEEAERVGARFSAAKARKAPFRDLDNINIHKDGRLIHVSTSGMPILGPDGSLHGYRGLDHDISAIKAAEAGLRARNEELERFNRASVGRELDMLEMKKTINALSKELGREPPYPLAFVKGGEEQGGP